MLVAGKFLDCLVYHTATNGSRSFFFLILNLCDINSPHYLLTFLLKFQQKKKMNLCILTFESSFMTVSQDKLCSSEVSRI